jgi:arsenate reductase
MGYTEGHPSRKTPMSLPSQPDELLLLHNPRCSKSRQVKALLEERGVDFVERRYLEDALDSEELTDLVGRLGQPISRWIRSRESEFAESGLSEQSGEADLIAAVAANPILMERPILIRGGAARVGRPPESVLSLL